MQSNLTTQSYWDGNWSQTHSIGKFSHFDAVAEHLPAHSGLTFFEIGCAPGRITAQFCKHFAYKAYGLDYAADAKNIESFLQSAGVDIGEIYQEDFFSWEQELRFDIVASFGFIEHFSDPHDVADKHFNFVKPGGTVVICFPNFAQGQKLLHWLFDKENLSRHNTKCMSVNFLKNIAKRNNAQIKAATYTGGHFNYWCEPQKRSKLTKLAQKYTTRTLHKVSGVLPAGTNPFFSPYLIGIFEAAGNPQT